MYRALSNTFFSLLLVASTLWGGCVSCDQFFMWPGAKGHCCQARKCERPSGKPADTSKPSPAQRDCQTMPLDRLAGTHSYSDIAADLWSTPAQAIFANALLFSNRASLLTTSHLDSVAASPPDLPILNASLLI